MLYEFSREVYYTLFIRTYYSRKLDCVLDEESREEKKKSIRENLNGSYKRVNQFEEEIYNVYVPKRA